MRPAMAELGKYVDIIWVLNVGIEIVLVLAMAVRKNYHAYPLFFSYLCVNILQVGLLLAIYHTWGFSALIAERLAWSTQAIVICARALAVAEVCRQLLSPFRGIWALVWRILLFSVTLAILCPILIGGWHGTWTIMRIELGLESTMMIVIVVLFVFARYYQILANDALRALGIGFFLLSSFTVVNDTILEHRLQQYVSLWRVLGMLSFLASLCLWFSALYKSAPARAAKPALLPVEIYRSLAPEINERLWALNEQLGRFWRVGAHGS